MKSHPRISELLVKTGAYKDLNEPVILTSGELGIYYINTEKLVQDGGEWKKYGKDSKAMIQHAIKMTKVHPTFEEVINILSKKASILIEQSGKFDKYTISGGQRRDWLFSGPVAAQLNLPHVSVYKDGKVEIIPPCGGGNGGSSPLENTLNLHISDLLTEASSCYRVEDGEKKGWIPSVRKEGAQVKDLIAVVTRLQGGEQRLKKIGVTVHPFVAIDENFVKQHSQNPKRAIAYMQSPKLWSKNYLKENGALSLIETFNPDSGKLDRVKKFLNRYGNVLAEADKWNELDSKVNKKYGTHLGQISGDIN